ncbi:cation:dicarboxylase symporter family transporter [Roseiconus nitratireducens]|uniref:Cation:dicarboxylase symporter family transporter n=1 Tax=Roseiconus nitratireducens TaxID=2605748 RepID=A0A5M6CVD8_9BACT|nr:cation:dicarboxylase symporter family transporter [Roseiconus nitratireducens]KAA5537952.1 cation:dicarboxylase symporter family transporter [Roseiconus nitratireducens]
MRSLSLTSLIFAGLALGIFTGLFFGERTQVLAPIGDGFIRLLQMAVLPYFIVALPLGFGRLSFHEAKQLALRLGSFSLVFWGIAMLLVVLLPTAFPALESASFFSASLVESPQAVDFVELYIPANPFLSLSQAVIPGVVVFGIAMGIALIGVPEKKQLLNVLDALADALGRITGFVVRLTPIGVFALAASAAGAMTLEDLSRLQVYFVAYSVGALLLTFYLVPMFVSALTPFSYREVMAATRDPLVTGFTTGNLLVVLAMLAENCKRLFQQRDEEHSRHAESVIDVTLPIAFTFPNLGVVMMLLFVPFAAWFTGNPLPWAEFPKLCFLGFFSFFGSVEIGLPFLLQQMRIPTDMFQLHVVTLVYVGRVATLVAVMHLAGVALLSAAGNARWLSLRPRPLIRYAAGSCVVLFLAVAATSATLIRTVDQNYSKDQVLGRMEPIQFATTGKVFRETAPRPNPTDSAHDLDAIRERGVLRVGYDAGGLPFSFFNQGGDLVGFDIEMCQAFAKELGVKVEYFPYEKARMSRCLADEPCYDLLVGGLFATPRRVEQMRFSEPYLDLHLAFIAADHRKDEFAKLADLRKLGQLRIAVLERPYFGSRVKQVAPNAEVVLVDSPKEFFNGDHDFDALVMSAEAGSAWTLLHPEYSVVIPTDGHLVVSVGYPIGLEATRLERVLSRWIDLKQKDGTIQQLYEHWIEGKNAELAGPRWNILNDVIGYRGEGGSSRLAAKP